VTSRRSGMMLGVFVWVYNSRQRRSPGKLIQKLGIEIHFIDMTGSSFECVVVWQESLGLSLNLASAVEIGG